MHKKAQVHIRLENNCLGWKIKTPTGSQEFGVALKINKDGERFYENFLWQIPAKNTPNLKTFLAEVANASLVEDLKRKQTRNKRRMAVEKIKIKPYQEEIFQSIISKLQPTK